MTTKNKYGQHNKRKNARAQNNKRKPILQEVSPEKRKDLLEQIRQADAAGADCVIDMSDNDRICILRKNPITGRWGSDLEALNTIKESIESGLYD